MYFHHIFGSDLFTNFWGQTSIRPLIWKFSILGQRRDLVCRGILHANYLPSSHMWVERMHLDTQWPSYLGLSTITFLLSGMEKLRPQLELQISSHQSGTVSIATMWQHAGVPPDMCGAGPKARNQHSNWETAQMLGWSSLCQRWLTVLLKSGPINTIFEGADTDPPRSRMPTLPFEYTNASSKN